MPRTTQEETLGGMFLAAFYPEEFLEEVRARNDIVDVVGAYVRLTRKGRNFWGLCPFHNEKTPSFSVSPDKDMYYCFGCHAGGSVFQFIQHVERCDFPDAVRLLAERAGLEPPKTTQARQDDKRPLYFDAMRAAARFYHSQLYAPQGQKGLEYLHKRGVSDAIIRRFGIGWAPEQGDALIRHFEEQGMDIKALAPIYLTGEKNGRRYDFFRRRVMFPVVDRRGNVVAFGGRVLDDSQPKYINTPETPIFKKRENLYGINLVHKRKQVDKLFIAEGYMDVVSLHAAGIDWAVATLGTALTVEQARLLKRYTNNLYLGYDGDSAGQQAMLRGGDVLRQQELNIRVVTFPKGMDPDDFARAKGQAGIEDLIENSDSLNDYLLKIVGSKYDMSINEERVRYVEQVCRDVLIKIESPIEREAYVKVLAHRSGISAPAIEEQLSRIKGGSGGRGEKTDRLVKNIDRAVGNAKESHNQPGNDGAGASKAMDSALAKAEETLALIALQNRKKAAELKSLFSIKDFGLPHVRSVLETLWEADDAPSESALQAGLEPKEYAQLARMRMEYDNIGDMAAVFADCATQMQMRKISSRIYAIGVELESDAINDEQRATLKRELAQASTVQMSLKSGRGSLQLGSGDEEEAF